MECSVNIVKLFARNIDIRKEFDENNFPYAWKMLPITLRSSNRNILILVFNPKAKN